jgi:hypothetical protein
MVSTLCAITISIVHVGTLFGESVDILSGGAGWAGAGLLGLVLGWLLLKHLPEKDKQLEKLIASQIEANKEERRDFKAALQLVVEHCEREGLKRDEILEKIATKLTNELKAVHDAVREHDDKNNELHQQDRHLLANLAHEAKLRATAEDIKAQKKQSSG